MKRWMLAALALLFSAAGLARAQMVPDPGSADTLPPDTDFLTEAAPAPRWWVGAEYLHWWIKDGPLSTPLVTTGPVVNNLTPVLGQPGTQVLIGGRDIKFGGQSGARFALGGWIDSGQTLGVEGTYFFLAKHGVSSSVSSSGASDSAFLALPFYDVTVPGESSTRIALPGGFSGTAILTTSTRLQGWEVTGVASLACTPRFRLEGLGGFRYWNLEEDLAFTTDSVTVIGPQDIFRTRDAFAAGNHFYGGQVGLRGEYAWGALFIEGAGKVALGNMHQTVNINGELVTNDFNNLGPAQVFPGGYFTQRTNIGRTSHDRFAVIPEVNVKLGLRLGSQFRAWAGYSFQYVSDVVRPGDQIDRGINPVQAPAITGVPDAAFSGPARPAALFRTTDFWAHGLNVGLELRF